MEFSGKSHHWLSRDLNLKSKFKFQSDLMASGLPWEYRTPRPGAGRRRRPWRNRKSTFYVVSSLNLSLGLAAYALRLNHRALFWSRFHWHDTFSLSANGKKVDEILFGFFDGQPVRLISGGGERKNRFGCQSKNQWSQRRPQSYTYHTHHSVHQKKQVDRSLHNLI